VRTFYSALASCALFAGACGNDQPTEVNSLTINDLVGSWEAASVMYTSNAAPSQQFDLIANGGETRVTVLPGGGARTWVDFGAFHDEWDAQLTLNGSTLTSTPVEASRAVRQYDVVLEGSTLTLTDDNASFDFTLSDLPPTPAAEVAVLIRN